MLLQPVLGFSSGHHEQYRHALHREPGRGAVPVTADNRGSPIQFGGPGSVPHQQALGGTGRCYVPRHHPAQPAGGTGDG